MALDLTLLELAEVTATDGFFNDVEGDVVNAIVTGGSGIYKLTQDKGGGNFVAAELATTAADTAVVSNDRVFEEGDSESAHDYLYVKFKVESV